jgi:HK97 family phage portal protein
MYAWTFDPSMPPILELVYDTPIAYCKELIGVALAAQIYTAKFFANGGRLAGVLQAAGAVSNETVERLRATWTEKFTKPENSHKIAILDGGIEYKPFASANNDAQLNELMATITQAICGVFRVPVWKVGDLTKATYSNMQAGELAYVTSTLDPFYQLWEDAIRRDLLTTRQFNQYSVQFDRAALIRSDVQAGRIKARRTWGCGP